MISVYTNIDFTIIGRLPARILPSSVCSGWRIVVGTRLWSSVMIDLTSISQTPDMASSTMLRLATFIDEWLARSGQLPLNISLCSGRETPWNHPLTLEKCRPIFKTLDQYLSRWHRLNISIPPTILPFLQPDCLPLLEQLRILPSMTLIISSPFLLHCTMLKPN